VKKKQEVPSKEGVEDARGSHAQPKVLLPHEGGLWLPDGKPFPQDFRRAMSFMSG